MQIGLPFHPRLFDYANHASRYASIAHHPSFASTRRIDSVLGADVAAVGPKDPKNWEFCRIFKRFGKIRICFGLLITGKK
jgi:hypothetical protein